MKIKFLLTGFLGMLTVAAFAQKGAVSDANDAFTKYDAFRSNSHKIAIQSLADAKTAIDKAAANEKTATWPQTWALKGAIYAALTVEDSIPASAAEKFKIADETLQKAKSLDSAKQENKKIIEEGFLSLAQYKFNEGRTEFSNKKYADAYNSFEYYHKLRPDDTTALYVTGLSAANAGNTDPKYYQYAVANYNKLLATNYSGNAEIYKDLSLIYLAQKDTANAFRVAGDGVAKYPGNADLGRQEIVIGLQSGKQDVLTDKIQAAIAADPKNKQLYYFAGLTYAQISDALDAKRAKAKDAATKAKFEQQSNDACIKGMEPLKKALDLDPNYAEAAQVLAGLALKPVINLYNDANQLPTTQQKQYDADLAKVQTDADAVKPYILKSAELNPTSADALRNLKNFYILKKDMADANATQKKIDALLSK
jgi:hypothetical protein